MISTPEPKQLPTPETSPRDKSKQRLSPLSKTSSFNSMASADEDAGYESRSRSASRRRRRQNQRQRGAQSKAEAGKSKANSQAMATVAEEYQQPQQQQQQKQLEPSEKQKRTTYADEGTWLKNPATQDTTEQQPFEHIKPPSQSMDGPVTYARMMRGEIPWRGPPPRQPYNTTQGVDAKVDAPDPMDQDGLKLRLELNLDIEIELKAHIHGDITLALL